MGKADEIILPQSLADVCKSEIIFILREKLILAKRPNLGVTDPNSGYGRAAQYLTKRYTSTQEERDYLYLIWDNHNRETNSSYQNIVNKVAEDSYNSTLRQETLDKLKIRIAERKLQRQQHFELEWNRLVFLGNKEHNLRELSPKQFQSSGTKLLKKLRNLVHLFNKVAMGDFELKCLTFSSSAMTASPRPRKSGSPTMEKDTQCNATFTHGRVDKDGKLIDYKLGDCPCWNWRYGQNHCCFCGSPMYNYDRNLVSYLEDGTNKSDSI